jgi:Bacterial Ig-like domain (group 3)
MGKHRAAASGWRRSVTSVAVVATAAAGMTAISHPAQADPVMQTLVNDSFAGTTTASPVVALTQNPGFPCLTAGTDPAATPLPACQTAPADAAGNGVLRFTDNKTFEASGIIYNSSVPLVKGLVATFNAYQWGGTGADGISFDLAVAPPTPTHLGSNGGGLGYAMDPGVSGSVGLPGGYLGIGLDTFGTYTNAQNPNQCPQVTASGPTRNWVTVRGPGNGTRGYCVLSARSTPLRATTRALAKRSVKVTVDPDAKQYTVGLASPGETTYTTVAQGPLPTSYYDPTTGAAVAGLPTRLTFAVAGSTGAATDYHEIDDLNVTTLNGAVPVLTLSDTDDSAGRVQAGGAFNYTLTPAVSSDGGAEDLPSSLKVTDTLPTGVTLTATPTGTNWDCSGSTTTAVTCAYSGTTSVPAGTALPPITVPAQVAPDAAVGSTLTDAASVISDDAATPASATDSITVAAVAPAVTADPADQFVTSSQDATFSAAASGNPAPTGQWQSRTDGGSTWTDVVGATGDSLTVHNVTVAADDGTQYRVVYSNSGGSATSNPATLHVGKGTSTTSAMTLSGNAFVGVQRSYVATVTPAPAAIPVTGSVTFTDSGSAIPSCSAIPVAGHQATCEATWGAAGTHHIRATYNGSTELLASTAPEVVDTIAPVATSTALSVTPTSAVVGQPVTYSATVSEHGPGSAPLEGTVTFRDGATALPGCSDVVLDASGTATCTVAFPHAGPHAVTATYGAGAATGGSASDEVNLVVGTGATTTTLTASPNPSPLNQAVTFTATVTTVAPASGPIDGTVTFFDGTTVIGSRPVGGAPGGGFGAAFSTTSLSGGAHTITASYSGNGDFSASTSNPVVQTVTQGRTTLVAAPYITINLLTLKLTPSAKLTAGAVPVVGRTVTFTAAGATICSAQTAANGVASCTGRVVLSLLRVVLSLGYTASFAGDADYLPASDRGALIGL